MYTSLDTKCFDSKTNTNSENVCGTLSLYLSAPTPLAEPLLRAHTSVARRKLDNFHGISWEQAHISEVAEKASVQ